MPIFRNKEEVWQYLQERARRLHEDLTQNYRMEKIQDLSVYEIHPHGEYSEVFFPEWGHLLRDPETFASLIWNSPQKAHEYMATQYPHLHESKPSEE